METTVITYLEDAPSASAAVMGSEWFGPLALAAHLDDHPVGLRNVLMLEIEFDGHVARLRSDGAHVGHHEEASHSVAHHELQHTQQWRALQQRHYDLRHQNKVHIPDEPEHKACGQQADPP
jgi:hypothetical protein